MGYSTYFEGQMTITPDVTPLDLAAVSKAITEQSRGTTSLPRYHCGWEITNDFGVWHIEHDGGEKFYNYVEWMEFIVKELAGRGYTVEGKIRWQGEEGDDSGVIRVVNNQVKHARDTRTNPLD